MADLGSIAALKTDVNSKIKYNADIPHDSTKTSGNDDRENRENIIDTLLAEQARTSRAQVNITNAAAVLPNTDVFYAINASTNITQNLTTVGISDGTEYQFKRIDNTSNTVTISGLGSDPTPILIVSGNYTLKPGESLKVRKIAGNWYIIT